MEGMTRNMHLYIKRNNKKKNVRGYFWELSDELMNKI